jgi:hypothetical protein
MGLSRSAAAGMRRPSLSRVAAKRFLWSRLASLAYSPLVPSRLLARSQPVRIPISTKNKIRTKNPDFIFSGAFWTKSELSSRRIRTLILKILAVLEVNSDPRQHEPESLCDGLRLAAFCLVCAQGKGGQLGEQLYEQLYERLYEPGFIQQTPI